MQKRTLFSINQLGQKYRYVLSGILSFVTENTSFNIFYYILSLDYRYSNIASVTIAVFVNFFVTRKFVFRTHGENKLGQFAKYIPVVLMNLVITTIAIGALINSGIPGFVAKFGMAILATLWTYFIYKKIVFRSTNT